MVREVLYVVLAAARLEGMARRFKGLKRERSHSPGTTLHVPIGLESLIFSDFRTVKLLQLLMF